MKKLNGLLLISAMVGVGYSNIQTTMIFNRNNKPISVYNAKKGEGANCRSQSHISLCSVFKNGQFYTYIKMLPSYTVMVAERVSTESKKAFVSSKKQIYELIAKKRQEELSEHIENSYHVFV